MESVQGYSGCQLACGLYCLGRAGSTVSDGLYSLLSVLVGDPLTAK